MGPKKYIILAFLSILLFGSTSQGHVTSLRSNSVRQPPPGIANKPFCRKPSTAVTGRCICYVIVSKTVKFKNQQAGVRICTGLYGSEKAVLKFGSNCNKFKKNGKINVKTLVAAANKVVKVCLPGKPKIMLA